MYTQTIVAGLLAAATLSHAAPLSARTAPTDSTSAPANITTVDYTKTAPASVYSAPASTPSAPAASSPQPYATILPDTTSLYHSKTGAVEFDTYRGYVSRTPTNGGDDVTTLVTFALDGQYASRQCQLVFDLQGPDAYASGTQKAQLFTSLAPATETTESWPSGNQRNQNLGTINVVAGGRATWEAGSGPGATSNGYFPCSQITNQVYGGEVVPVGDVDTISWVASRDGPKILVW